MGKAPKPAAAERGRAPAAGGTTRDTERRKGKGTGNTRIDAGRAPMRAATERMERSRVRSTNGGAARDMGTGAGRIQALAVRARARVTEGGTDDVGGQKKARDPARDPRARGGKGGVDPRGMAGPGTEVRRGGQGGGRGTGSGEPPQPEVQPVRCIPPSI